MSAADLTPAVYIEHDGRPVMASDLVWLHIAACGCMSGASTADRGNGDVLMSAEQVRADRCDGIKALIKRDQEDGGTYRLATWDEFKSLRMDCEHDPKWGVLTVTVPDGHSWATTDRWHAGRRTHTKHIVPVTRECDRDSAALCGYTPARRSSWSTDRNDVGDTVTCRKCEAKTRAVDA